MQTGIITKFEPMKPYKKKDDTESVVTTIEIKVGEITKYDAITGEPKRVPQIIVCNKYKQYAERFANLNLVVGQQVQVELDYIYKFGHTEVDVISIQPFQAQQPQYQPLTF